MAVFVFANDASSTLAAPISSVATTVNLAVGTGALFPSPGAGQQFALTFNDAATGLLTEIVYCTARTGDALTIVRAQEGTSAQAWLAADLAANLLTAGQMQALVQTSQAQFGLPTPGGYLTLSTGQPIINADQTGKTSVFWCPFKSNQTIFWNGTQFAVATFSQQTLTLTGSLAGSTLVDVYQINDGAGNPIVAYGVPWTNSTPGAANRGTGAGTAQITPSPVGQTNAVAQTMTNGVTTYGVPANQGRLIGTIFTDPTAGHVSCYVSSGQSRIWGVSNVDNPQPVQLLVSDPTSQWTYGTVGWRPSNGNAANTMVTCRSLPTPIQATFQQIVGAVNGEEVELAVGVNSTNVPADYIPTFGLPGQTNTLNGSLSMAATTVAANAGADGLHSLESIESGTGNAVFFGGAIAMRLAANWLA